MKLTTLALSATIVSSAFAAQEAKPRALGRRGDVDAPQWVKRSVQNDKRQGAVPNGALFLTVAANATAEVANATAEVVVPTYNGTALWYKANGETGACREVSTDEDLVIGIPVAFWSFAGDVSPLCGEKVVVYAGEKNVTATLLDATGVDYVSLSVGAFSALSPLSAGMISVQYQFLNATLGATLNASLNATILHSTPLLSANATLANPYLSLNAEASTDGTPVAAVSAALSVAVPDVVVPTPTAAPVPSSSAVAAEPSSSNNNGAASAAAASSRAAAQSAAAASAQASASAAQAAAAAQASEDQENQRAQEAAKQESQRAQQAEQAASRAASQAAASSSSAAAAAASSQAAAEALNVKDAADAAAAEVVEPVAQAGSSVFSGGKATYFYQNGVAGHCGTVHSESFKGVAIQSARYDNGANCWRMVEITRTSSGAKVIAQVVDSCPGCPNEQSLDLSEGAFLDIATKSEGMVDISWRFLD